MEVTRRTLRRHEKRDQLLAAKAKQGEAHTQGATIPPLRTPTPPTHDSPPFEPPPVPTAPATPNIPTFDWWPEPVSLASPISDVTSLFGSPINHDPFPLPSMDIDRPVSASPAPSQSSQLSRASAHTLHHRETPTRQSQNLTDVHYFPGEDPSLFERPSGCSEQAHIRIAYLKAVALHVIDRLPRDRVELDLDASMAAYAILDAIPTRPKPVTSLASVLERLGLDADPYLTQVPMCSVCYCIYDFDFIISSRSPACTQRGCNGAVWEPTNNPPTRKPKRVAAYGNIIAWLRRMFMRPDFVAALRSAEHAHVQHLADNRSVLYDVCDGSAWSQDSFGLKRALELDGTVSDVASQPNQQIPLGFGLFASLNLDWFRITEKYSVGGIYLSILNLHRSVRNLPWNIILACTIPGPGEPSLEDLNHVLQPVVDEFKRLYAGITIRVFEETLPQQIESYVDTAALKLHMSNNASPARQKVTGTPAQNSALHFCICRLARKDVNTPRGYDIESFEMRDDWEAIQLAFDIRGADKDERNDFAAHHGVRWSALNELPGWLTYSSAPLDIMHNLYLGIVRHLWNNVLISGYMFTTAEKLQFEAFLDSIQWPSNTGRVPKNLTKVSTKKADEWRRLSAVLMVGLWFVWRNHIDQIPPGAPRIPSNAETPPKFTRCRQRLYDVITYLCAAVRLFSAWSISLTDVHRAQTFLQWYCQGLLQLNIHLNPNHHWAMHYEPIFKRFGPACAWWVYAFERYNGLLQKVNLNYHEGEMETTLMRFWIRMHRLYELAQFLPDSATDAERNLLRKMCSEYGHRATANATRIAAAGGLAEATAPQATRASAINLRSLPHQNIYPLILQFARHTWPELNLQHEMSLDTSGPALWSDRCARSLASIFKGGIRFGCSTSKRSSRDQNAFVLLDGHSVPVRLVYHFELTVPGQAPTICSVIQRFIYDETIPKLPWDLYAVELGIYVSHADRLGPLEVVCASKIQAPLALCPVTLRRPRIKIWISINYDRDSVEEFTGDGEPDIDDGEAAADMAQ